MTTDYVLTDPRPVLKPDALYMGDGGRVFCGNHARMTARYTGRDISGQKVWVVTDQDREEFRREVGRWPACETCLAIARSGESR